MDDRDAGLTAMSGPPQRTWLDADHFNGKLLLSVIDKLVLGVAAMIVLGSFQQCQARRQEVRLQLAKQRIEQISAERDTLGKLFTQHLTTLREIADAATAADDQQAGVLRQARLGMEESIIRLRAVHPDIETQATAFLEAVNDMNQRATTDPGEVSKSLDGYRTRYFVFIESVRNLFSRAFSDP